MWYTYWNGNLWTMTQITAMLITDVLLWWWEP